MLILPKDPTAARPLLDQFKTQRTHCTLFVLLNGEEGAQLASKADVRSENHPFRKVVWVADPAVLQGVPGYEPLLAEVTSRSQMCALTFDFQIVARRGANESIDLLDIERAFIKAEVGA